MTKLDQALRCAEQLSLPALHLVRARCTGFSKIGGLPALPPELVWPVWRAEPLAFLAQVDLSEMAPGAAPTWFPRCGVLYFFYDKEQSTWGFDPKDVGSWRVLYSATRPSEVELTEGPGELESQLVYGSAAIEFKSILSQPSWERLELDITEMTERDLRMLSDAQSSTFGDLPKHQMFGLPTPIQNDSMELECQLGSNGIYCGSSAGYENDGAQALSAGARDWRLLLQLDTDDDLGMMWGDVGMLYFWIREQDARKCDFSRVWMILQCC